MSDYDQRQFRLMLERLDAFARGRIAIDRLIIDLQGLLNALQMLDPKWKQSFLRHWGHLEEARAVALDREATTLNEREAKVAFDAAMQLRLLVLEQIDDIADHPRDIDWTKQQ
jgi:hypothetical protein